MCMCRSTVRRRYEQHIHTVIDDSAIPNLPINTYPGEGFTESEYNVTSSRKEKSPFSPLPLVRTRILEGITHCDLIYSSLFSYLRGKERRSVCMYVCTRTCTVHIIHISLIDDYLPMQRSPYLPFLSNGEFMYVCMY